MAAALGLSAILATSATAYTVVKWVGAVYLIILGIGALRRAGRSAGSDPAGHAPALEGGRLVTHAAISGLLNPKVAVFFLAFLPQFVRPERGRLVLQFISLGLGLALLGVLGDSIIAILAGRACDRFLAQPGLTAWRERVTGAVLVALGLRLAVADSR